MHDLESDFLQRALGFNYSLKAHSHPASHAADEAACLPPTPMVPISVLPSVVPDKVCEISDFMEPAEEYEAEGAGPANH